MSGTNELANQFNSAIEPHMKRIVKAVDQVVVNASNSIARNGYAVENVIEGSPCSLERNVSEQQLSISEETSYLTIAGVAEYTTWIHCIAGKHTIAAAILVMSEVAYDFSASAKALVRVSVEASASAAWLLDSTIAWDERLRRYAVLYKDNMRATSYDTDAFDSASEISNEMEHHGWVYPTKPTKAKIVSTMWETLGRDRPKWLYGYLSESIHASPKSDTLCASFGAVLLRRVLSVTWVLQSCIAWLNSDDLLNEWQNLPKFNNAWQDLNSFGVVLAEWMDIAMNEERKSVESGPNSALYMSTPPLWSESS